MQVTPLKRQNLAAIMQLAQEDPTCWSAAAWHSSLEAGEVFGIHREGQLAAVLALRQGYLELEVLYLLVASSLRQQGLAKQLLGFAEHQARVQQAERLLLEVRESNAAALALYRGYGLIEEGRRKNYYASQASPTGREDALLMSLPLIEVR